MEMIPETNLCLFFSRMAMMVFSLPVISWIEIQTMLAVFTGGCWQWGDAAN